VTGLGEASLRLRRAVVRHHRAATRALPDRHLPWPVRGGWCYLNLRESPPMLERALRVYERNKFAMLGSFLRPGMSFVDIGSNKGDFAVFAAGRLQGRGTVVAVEPSPENARWVRRSIERSRLPNVHLVEAALAESPGEAVLHLRALSGWHTLMPASDAVGEVTVQTRTLDDVAEEHGLRSVDALKVDVEGGELGVLRGAGSVLEAPGERLVLLDLHPPLVDPVEIAGMLRDAGYRILSPEPPHGPLEVDGLTRELVARR
jgi:FkbM family methyltransferase